MFEIRFCLWQEQFMNPWFKNCPSCFIFGLTSLLRMSLVVSYFQLSITNFLMPIANCALPITYCPLPITNCKLPITNCQLPITKWPKNISISSQFSYEFDSIELHSCYNIEFVIIRLLLGFITFVPRFLNDFSRQFLLSHPLIAWNCSGTYAFA